MMKIITDIFTSFCQEAALISMIFIYLILNFIFGKKIFKLSKIIAVISVLLAILSSLKIQIIPTYYAFNGAFLSNFYIVFFKILILICSLAVLLISKNIVLTKRSKIYDYYTFILIATLGAISLVASDDFLSMFIILQLTGISTFIMMLFSKNSEAEKAAIKYFITQIVSSAVILLGISYIYMSTGSLNFEVIYSFLNQGNEISPFFDIGCILCSLGLTFYIGIIPFSNWVSDSFEKINRNTILFLSIVPVVAVFGLISRLIVFIFQYTPMVQALLFIIGILSIFKGVLCLLRQDSLNSFMGYSFNAQSGFIILGFCLATPYAVSNSLFYILTYIVATFGMYICLNELLIEHRIKEINALKGLVYKNKLLALTITIFLFSLAGLPITAGFLAKIFLFGSIIKCTNLYLAFLGITLPAVVIGIYAYCRPIKSMLETNKNFYITNLKFSLQKLILYTCAIITVLICILPDMIVQICQFIAYQL